MSTCSASGAVTPRQAAGEFEIDKDEATEENENDDDTEDAEYQIVEAQPERHLSLPRIQRVLRLRRSIRTRNLKVTAEANYQLIYPSVYPQDDSVTSMMTCDNSHWQTKSPKHIRVFFISLRRSLVLCS